MSRIQVVIRKELPDSTQPGHGGKPGATAQVLDYIRKHGAFGKGSVRPEVIGVLERQADLRPRLRTK